MIEDDVKHVRRFWEFGAQVTSPRGHGSVLLLDKCTPRIRCRPTRTGSTSGG